MRQPRVIQTARTRQCLLLAVLVAAVMLLSAARGFLVDSLLSEGYRGACGAGLGERRPAPAAGQRAGCVPQAVNAAVVGDEAPAGCSF